MPDETKKKPMEKKKTKKVKTPSSSPDGASGAQRGTIVHKQVQLLFVLNAEQQQGTLLALYPRGIDPYATRLYAAYKRRGWYPLAAEFVVYDMELGIATPVDQLLVNSEGHLIVVELKTEYGRQAFRRPDRGWRDKNNPADMLLKPGRLINVWRPEHRCLLKGHCTPLKKARIQCGIGTLMLMRLLGLPLGCLSAYVVRVSEEPIEFLEVKREWLQTQGLALYRTLATAMQQGGGQAVAGETTKKRQRPPDELPKNKKPRIFL
jgi:hypothetical protein